MRGAGVPDSTLPDEIVALAGTQAARVLEGGGVSVCALQGVLGDSPVFLQAGRWWIVFLSPDDLRRPTFGLSTTTATARALIAAITAARDDGRLAAISLKPGTIAVGPKGGAPSISIVNPPNGSGPWVGVGPAEPIVPPERPGAAAGRSGGLAP